MRSVAPRSCASCKRTVNNWTSKLGLSLSKNAFLAHADNRKNRPKCCVKCQEYTMPPRFKACSNEHSLSPLFPVAIQLHHISRHSMFTTLRREHHQSLHHRLVAQALMSRPMFFISCSRPNRCEVGSHFLHSQKQWEVFKPFPLDFLCHKIKTRRQNCNEVCYQKRKKYTHTPKESWQRMCQQMAHRSSTSQKWRN